MRTAHCQPWLPFKVLGASVPSHLRHHLFLHLTRERQELNLQGFGRLGHRNATWVRCLLPSSSWKAKLPSRNPQSLLSVPLPLRHMKPPTL